MNPALSPILLIVAGYGLCASSVAMAETTAEQNLDVLLGIAGGGGQELFAWIVIAVAGAVAMALFGWVNREGEHRDGDLDDMAPDRSHLWKSPPKADWLERAEFEIAASAEHADCGKPTLNPKSRAVREFNGPHGPRS